METRLKKRKCPFLLIIENAVSLSPIPLDQFGGNSEDSEVAVQRILQNSNLFPLHNYKIIRL